MGPLGGRELEAGDREREREREREVLHNTPDMSPMVPQPRTIFGVDAVVVEVVIGRVYDPDDTSREVDEECGNEQGQTAVL